MGVYVPNMEKPKRCAYCECADEDWWCKLDLNLSYVNEKEQYEHCPLIEIDKETEHHILNLWEYAKDMKVNMEQARKDLTVADLVTCKECKHFHYDKPYVIQGMPILGHEVCDFWGDGCKTNPNGFCSYGERREE